MPDPLKVLTMPNHESALPATPQSFLENDGILFNILDFLDQENRGNAMLVSKAMWKLLISRAGYIWRLERLHAEYGIYFSPDHKLFDTSYKELFLERFPRRYLWVADPNTAKDQEEEVESQRQERFQVSVSARFKPRSAEDFDPTVYKNHVPRKVILPLHQRLSLIRLSRNLNSNEDAIKILQQQGGIGWKKEPLKNVSENIVYVSAGDTKESSKEEIFPSSEKENPVPVTLPSLTGGLNQIDNKNGRVIVVDPTKGLREFPFDQVLSDSCSQAEAYDRVAHRLVSDFLCGYNSTCLVFGQTGSGKTYTMFGHEEAILSPMPATSRGSPLHYTWGIIPRACKEIFDAVEYRKSSENLSHPIESSVTMSYVEVYGETIGDLLDGNRPCGRSRVAAQGFVLGGSAERPVSSFDEAMDLIQLGQQQKRVAATAMNERSSRAHSLVSFKLVQKCAETDRTVTSRIFMVDLGGSEQLKKSQAHFQDGKIDVASRRQRTVEAIQINIGLLALKKCVEALSKVSKAKDPSKVYVPYADSKLTMLLSSGLGGNSKTNFIICGSQEEAHASEMIATLQFGQTCAKISKSTHPRSQDKMLEDMITDIDEGIQECKKLIEKHERWETRQEKHSDGYGGHEFRTVSKLVGAEAHHARMESLLRRRAELTGTIFDPAPVSA